MCVCVCVRVRLVHGDAAAESCDDNNGFNSERDDASQGMRACACYHHAEKVLYQVRTNVARFYARHNSTAALRVVVVVGWCLCLTLLLQ